MGSTQDAQQLLENYIKSFAFRFIGFFVIGIIGFSVLVFINWLLIKFNKCSINLKKLILQGFIFIVIGSLIGTSVFFYLI
ncbi:MAG: hypothetical protein CVU07_07515 [Bacteroidetes bacterium HGW-Bacteroidetes-23]|nr:MAG: hypothetical protein CVU07_07515 [Bacteroidetes bacterium HGW-Bacteroidetes-23]